MQKLILVCAFTCITASLWAQNSGADKVERTLQKGDRAVSKVQNIISIFQPYLLKAQLLYSQGKQLVGDVKSAAKNTGQQNSSYDPSSSYPTPGATAADPTYNNGNTYPADNSYPTGNSYPPDKSGNTANNTSIFSSQDMYLPVNNNASINSDGSGNWGNQNNGLYGNCLDALTGTVMGMGEAADNPASVDIMFFAPTDGNGNYVLMTPGFAKNNGTATYMTEHNSDPVLQWKEVTESEIAATNITIGQFSQIQNNNQIKNAVLNAKNYAGHYTAVGRKLEGMVFAVRVQMENRELYTLIAVDKHIGTSGSNGYLKIRIKTQGIDNNRNGYPDANIYIR